MVGCVYIVTNNHTQTSKTTSYIPAAIAAVQIARGRTIGILSLCNKILYCTQDWGESFADGDGAC